MAVRNQGMSSPADLRERLEQFYRTYNFSGRLTYDPIAFPRRYSRAEDSEVAGFVASSLAYGRVDLFRPVIEKILSPGGKRPAEFFGNFSEKKDRKYFQGIVYRFQRGDDILSFLCIVKGALQKWGSLKNLFYHHYASSDEDITGALRGFVQSLILPESSSVRGSTGKRPGLVHLLPSPDRGSACKRLNLFLRWMVRRADIDLGLWEQIPPSKLIIPLDTHIYRISRCLELTQRKSADWKTAQDITRSLRKMDPDDPLKYDFALCHLGISGLCRGKKSLTGCSFCALISQQ